MPHHFIRLTPAGGSRKTVPITMKGMIAGMKLRFMARITGLILLVEAAAMLLPLIVSFIYGGQDSKAFLISIAAAGMAGELLVVAAGKPDRQSLQARDGFAIVAVCWIMLSLFGALPFVISGDIPNFGDALFETISGFTTTGATVLTEIESLNRGILFWRSFTHWVGGMGVLILFLALLPALGGKSIQLLRAESPGPAPSKLVPKIGSTAKILYLIYFVLTIAEIVALKLAGMSAYDSIVHAFATAGTGGFSVRNTSIAAYGSVPIEIVITVFTFIFGVNFAVYYQIIRRQFGKAAKNTELRAYIFIVLITVALITVDLSVYYEKIGAAINHAFFQVTSIITTTGFASVDFNLWPDFSKMLLAALMVMGACAGSTSGGVKIIRVVILFKSVAREIKKIIYPRSVSIVRIDGQAVGEDVISGCMKYFSAYICVLAVSSVVLSLDNFGFTSSFTAALSCLSNTGPGLEAVGPMGNYADFSYFSKAIMCFLMLAGRLEIYPMLVILAPSAWRRA